MKQVTKRNLLLAFLTLLCLACITLLMHIGRTPGQFDQIGSFKIPSTTKSGVVSGSLSLICILLVFTDYKRGFRIAFVINGFSLISLIISMVKSNSIMSMPGLVTSIVSFITLITIYSFYSRLSVSNLTDFITNQHNRRSYVKEISNRIDTKKAFTVACVEIEDFKHIYDMYGIQTGDFLLKKTAEKLSTILNKNDLLFRITGSTFVILFEPGESPEERLKTVIIPEAVVIPSSFENKDSNIPDDDPVGLSCIISLAAGLAYSHPPYNSNKTASSVLRDAETALSATRNMTKQKICIYDENMENQEVKQREAEYLVREALKSNYFYLVYQPQFTTNERKLRGFETLIRCRMPDGTIVHPTSFIPSAEKTNLILQIDEFVLSTAMTEFQSLITSSQEKLILSVNVSARNIASVDFTQRIKSLIENTHFPPECLEIEITEYSFAESLETTISNINQLRAMGIQIALDDFGTGYTSLKQIMELPINLLKIDKSLIDNVESDSNLQVVIDSVIYMGHIMNCEVISEGVEKEIQVDFLSRHKCDFIQGFVWSQPLSFDDAKILCK